MSFILETTEIDLGDTPIENIFINDYMPMANGTYVKVYLLGYKYAHDRDLEISIDNNTIAKNLNIPLSEVLEAWEFWENKGIVEKIYNDEENKFNYKIKFLNLKQLYIKNNYRQVNTQEEELIKKPYSCSVEDLVGANQNPEINKMFNNIDYTMRRQLVPNEKKKILEWIFNYNMNPDIVEKAFQYGVEEKGKRNVNYIEGIIRNWYDKGITNMEALEEHFKDNNEKYYRYDKIMKHLGFGNRLPSVAEMKVIDKWFEEYEFTMELVLRGCENSRKTANPSINYIDGVLTSWYKKGIKNVDEIEEKDKPTTKQNYSSTSNKKKKPTTNKFHNFQQRTTKYTADQLEEVAKKRREEYYFQTKGRSK